MNIIVSVANNIIACVGVACNACLDPTWRSTTNTERRVAVHPATQSLSRLRICLPLIFPQLFAQNKHNNLTIIIINNKLYV